LNGINRLLARKPNAAKREALDKLPDLLGSPTKTTPKPANANASA
jgi:hypothetical protein